MTRKSSSNIVFAAALLLALIAAISALGQQAQAQIFATAGRYAWRQLSSGELNRTQATTFVRGHIGLRYYGYGGCSVLSAEDATCAQRESSVFYYDNDAHKFGLVANSNRTTIRVNGYGAQVEQKLYLLLGEELGAGGEPLGQARQVAIFDLLEKRWLASVTPKNDDQGPVARAGASVVVFDNKVVLAGGVAAGGVVQDDVWAYNVDEKTWQQMWPVKQQQPAPAPVTTTAAAASAALLASTDEADSPAAKSNSTSTEVQPIPRYYHVAGVNRNKMFVYGGATAQGQALGDNATHVFDLISHKWTQPDLHFDASDPALASPASRVGARAVVIPGLGMSKMYVHGGFEDASFAVPAQDTVHLIELEQVSNLYHVKNVFAPKEGAASPGRRQHAAMFPTKEGFVLVGGDRDGQVLSDAWLYLTEPTGVDFLLEYIYSNQVLVGAFGTAALLFIVTAGIFGLGRFIFYCVKRRKDKAFFARLRGDDV